MHNRIVVVWTWYYRRGIINQFKKETTQLCWIWLYNCDVNALNYNFRHWTDVSISVWYPFEWKSNRIIFVFTYLHQVLSSILTLSLNIGFDFSAYYLMGMISVQFQIVGMRLRSLGREVSMEVNGNIVPKIEQLLNCIRTHQNILR